MTWTKRYVDYINIYRPKPLRVETYDNEIRCTYEADKITYIVQDDLSEDIVSRADKGRKIIVCLNRFPNVKLVKKHWHDLVKNKNLKFLFVNPEVNMKWFLIPHLHDKVADFKSLKKGLKSLYESIPEVIDKT